jgi:hypothetical protein
MSNTNILPLYKRIFKNEYPTLNNDTTDTEISLAEEVRLLREQVEELVYWIRPMTGNLITGKSAVEEYERILSKGKLK